MRGNRVLGRSLSCWLFEMMCVAVRGVGDTVSGSERLYMPAQAMCHLHNRQAMLFNKHCSHVPYAAPHCMQPGDSHHMAFLHNHNHRSTGLKCVLSKVYASIINFCRLATSL